jgi:integrase
MLQKWHSKRDASILLTDIFFELISEHTFYFDGEGQAMSISYRKHEGKWEYRITYNDPFTKKRREKSKRGFSTKPEARYAAQEMEKKLLSGFEAENISTSLEQYLRDWLLLYKKGNVRKNTYILHHRNIEKHILPYFKSIDIKDLKPMMYQTFIKQLIDKGYSKRTVEIIHGTMNNAMKTAVKPLRKIEVNPCEGVLIPQPKNVKKDEGLKYMKTKDIPLFLKTAYLDNYIYYIFFKVLINTGMRKGEAAALRWCDIDLKAGKIHISNTLDFQPDNEEELLGDTKTFTSTRTIRMTEQISKELLEHKKWQNDNKLTFKDSYKHKLDLVFVRPDGSPLPKSTLFNAFSRILKKAGLPELEIHSLRHTHAVLLLESGATMKYVQERLGHKRIEITSDIYAHISDKIDEDSITEYESYVSNLME